MSSLLREVEDLLPNLPRLSMEQGLLKRVADRLRDLEDKELRYDALVKELESLQDCRRTIAGLRQRIQQQDSMIRHIKGGDW